MKKLIITATAICTVALSHAAKINWTSGTFYGVASSNGGWSETKVTSGDVTAYLFVLKDVTAYNNLYNSDAKTVSQNVYNAYKDKLNSDNYAATKSTGTSISLNDGNTYSAGDEQYAALLYILTDGDKSYYIGNVGDSGVLKSSSNVTKVDMALKVGGTGADMTSVGWQSTAAVPEPTSAMLLMLGLCGLALKRKNA